MRIPIKSWQNKRPGWTIRVRWYEGPDHDIRLQFESRDPAATDRDVKHKFYDNPAEAQADYEAFCNGDLTFEQLVGDELYL